jgi:hypothetical protein
MAASPTRDQDTGPKGEKLPRGPVRPKKLGGLAKQKPPDHNSAQRGNHVIQVAGFPGGEIQSEIIDHQDEHDALKDALPKTVVSLAGQHLPCVPQIESQPADRQELLLACHPRIDRESCARQQIDRDKARVRIMRGHGDFRGPFCQGHKRAGALVTHELAVADKVIVHRFPRAGIEQDRPGRLHLRQVESDPEVDGVQSQGKGFFALRDPVFVCGHDLCNVRRRRQIAPITDFLLQDEKLPLVSQEKCSLTDG